MVKGVNLTGFKNAEDSEIELLHPLLFSLEDEPNGSGAKYVPKANREANVVGRPPGSSPG